MAEAGNQLTADQMEDAIMEILPSVEAERLENLFALVSLPVPTDQQGRKNALRKTLMRFLCTPDEEGEDKIEEWLVVFSNLFPTGVVPKQEGVIEETTTENVEVITQPVTDAGTGEHAGLLASANRILMQTRNTGRNILPPQTSGQDASGATTAGLPTPPLNTGTLPRTVFSTNNLPNAPISSQHPRAEEVQVTRQRLREFKLPGMIGGSGESALAYSSLEFEVKKAKNLGYTELEIVAAIIPKIADKELRKGCELEEDLELAE